MIYRLTGVIAGFARLVEDTDLGFISASAAALIAIFLLWLHTL
jgi:hypothetical protein